jgi:(p)ppGpp synthase/HD superfamily hydrolase
MSDIVSRARELAHRAHDGQVDKAGRPYIEHVSRVAAAVAGDPEAEVVAWLHDVVEDHPEYSDEVFSFPPLIARAIDRITRKTVHPETYFACIRLDPIALRVKLADIADNVDESRLALLDPKTADRLRKKYAHALKALGVKP